MTTVGVAGTTELPVAVMVLYDLGYVVRMVRASMVEVMTRPYIRTAVLKGLPRRPVLWRHVLHNKFRQRQLRRLRNRLRHGCQRFGKLFVFCLPNYKLCPGLC